MSQESQKLRNIAIIAHLDSRDRLLQLNSVPAPGPVLDDMDIEVYQAPRTIIFADRRRHVEQNPTPVTSTNVYPKKCPG